MRINSCTDIKGNQKQTYQTEQNYDLSIWCVIEFILPFLLHIKKIILTHITGLRILY